MKLRRQPSSLSSDDADERYRPQKNRQADSAGLPKANDVNTATPKSHHISADPLWAPGSGELTNSPPSQTLRIGSRRILTATSPRDWLTSELSASLS
jgi:hypothetical protein